MILEGEKKALAAFRFAYEVAGKISDTPHSLAIGLSGVYGFRDKRQKAKDTRGRRISISAPIPQLDLINWQDRKVYILFDANVTTNTSVAFARSELALELSSRGAQVWLVDLPMWRTASMGSTTISPAMVPGRPFGSSTLPDSSTQRNGWRSLPSTDYGNELAFEILHGADFLYNRNTEQWLRWSGIIYAPDVMGAAEPEQCSMWRPSLKRDIYYRGENSRGNRKQKETLYRWRAEVAERSGTPRGLQEPHIKPAFRQARWRLRPA